MKKMVCIVLFILGTTVVFAQNGEIMHTSEGIYLVQIEYVGKNHGVEVYNNAVMVMKTNHQVYMEIKLTNGQWECVNNLLNRYQTARGDTFLIGIARGNVLYGVVCEFTSASEYSYWTLRSVSF